MKHSSRPNQRLTRLGWVLEHQAAPLHTAALEQLAVDLAAIDGHPPTGDRLGVRGPSAQATSVEAAALRANDLNDQATKIRNSLTALEQAAYAHMTLCRKTVTQVPAAANAELCDGRRYEGHHLPWIPHSRDEANGWHDPTCRELAGPSGLSDACLVRMNRWRTRNGLKPVNVQEAA